LENIPKDTDGNFSGGIGPDGYEVNIAAGLFFYVFNNQFIMSRSCLVVSFDFKANAFAVPCGGLGDFKIYFRVCRCDDHGGRYRLPRFSAQFNMAGIEKSKGFNLADEFNPDEGLGRVIGMNLHDLSDVVAAIAVGGQ